MPTAIAVPAPFALPAGRVFSEEFHRLRERALDWIHAYYDVDHLRRTGDWILALDPNVAEPLVIAALTHDMERTIPGGPFLDKVNTPWDDPVYNTAHCNRSAAVVATWLVAQGASEPFVRAVQQPIVEHEFGGSIEGDLMQAADSISFLEVNRALVVRWVRGKECSLERGRDKLRWMAERVRLARARDMARTQFEQAMADVDRQLAVSSSR